MYNFVDVVCIHIYVAFTNWENLQVQAVLIYTHFLQYYDKNISELDLLVYL